MDRVSQRFSQTVQTTINYFQAGLRYSYSYLYIYDYSPRETKDNHRVV